LVVCHPKEGVAVGKAATQPKLGSLEGIELAHPPV
jgi:hypothetical protein